MRAERPPCIGEILQVSEGGGAKTRYGYFLGFAEQRITIQLSGEKNPTKVSADRVNACRGAAVFVPGPLKQEERAQEKVTADYSEDPYPQAASPERTYDREWAGYLCIGILWTARLRQYQHRFSQPSTILLRIS